MRTNKVRATVPITTKKLILSSILIQDDDHRKVGYIVNRLVMEYIRNPDIYNSDYFEYIKFINLREKKIMIAVSFDDDDFKLVNQIAGFEIRSISKQFLWILNRIAHYIKHNKIKSIVLLNNEIKFIK